MSTINNESVNQAKKWLGLPGLDPEGKRELEDVLDAAIVGVAESAEELDDRFYRDLEFGTGGMRGIIGEGRNRINATTIRRATQGFAEHIIASAAAFGRTQAKAVIAFDSRKFSDLFAFETACVFIENGIETWLFSRLSATPLLSWAVRKLDCDGGVVVTASHNPRIYNGYKIYDRTGCQCLTDEAAAIIELIDAVELPEGIRTAADRYSGSVAGRISAAAAAEPLLHILPAGFEDEFVDEVLGASLRKNTAADLSVVYTPLNGAGNLPVRRALEKTGVRSVRVVPEQEKPDPDFTTCPYPNPEKTEALQLGLDLCAELAAAGDAPDVLIGTDPDSDRLGCAVYDGEKYVQLSGDQVGILFIDYIVESRLELGTMPADPAIITTIVSSPLSGAIAEANNIEVRKTLTGFKWIGDQINKLEHELELEPGAGGVQRFIFGYEESCGYLSAPHARDKDAVGASMLLCEAAGYYKSQGKTLLDRLEEIYERYGFYVEALSEFTRPGEKGMEEIARDMATAREESSQAKLGQPVIRVTDYANDETGLPVSDVVQYDLEDGSRVIFRPSGTEPKLKIYYACKGDTREAAEKTLKALKEAVIALF
ncbi:MAG: phospho-sugar mutase [Clostridiales Family XIII bacterium]|jgi:phosphoglucomutase|nr:phospho-sugar mutase [Clostridiales Family XIII bacterium]